MWLAVPLLYQEYETLIPFYVIDNDCKNKVAAASFVQMQADMWNLNLILTPQRRGALWGKKFTLIQNQ